ncbi:hypothetical protein KDX27_39135 [Burkholderia cenocepacia]|uniref:type IV secretory system conjugative DNA transfer family protein n=1 Tax=Burkholderia cenocepacia TaxID=95486 RepID=UPI001B9D56C8|nr:hypothetical protein [Burkholderia cenocepacia]MBR8029915.1 hypothetical protein [Burkholderia cenocepacia]MBR8173707.1 hypothetical protein [Burkholderia cenocepacia]
MNNLSPIASMGASSWGGVSLASLAVIAVAVYVVLRLTGIARQGQAVYQLKAIAAFAVETPVRLVLKPIMLVLAKLPGMKRCFDWLWSKMTDEAIERVADRLYRSSQDPLLRGDLEAVAAARYPKEKWPHVWMKDIPEDLRRSLIVDGRLFDGSAPAVVFTPSYVDTVLVGQAFRRAVLAGLFWAVVGILVWHPTAYLAGDLKSALFAAPDKSMPSTVYPIGNASMSTLHEDVWDAGELRKKQADAAGIQQKVRQDRIEAAFRHAPGGIINSLLFGLLVFLGTWRGLIRDGAQSKARPLLNITKESMVRWNYRPEVREIEYNAYRAQLKTVAEWDKTPLIEIGRASGVFGFRGHISAPMKSQPMRYSLQDMSQHTFIGGGTGEGKTRSIIVPVVEQILALRRDPASAGDLSSISLYCTDGKAVLWRDIKAAAVKAGQGNDVRVIGCNAAAGEFGVDLLDGVAPQLLADIVRSVARQAKGDAAADSFWPDMASELLRVAAVVARVWECTDDGLELIGRTGERIYSLVMIYQLAVDPDLQERAVRAVLTALDDAAQWPYIAHLAGAELMDAIRYLRGQWMTLANDTKTGITANVTNTMAPFASNAELRNTFASGRGQNLMPIADVWGSIALVNVSSLEYGVAGRIINVMLKTLLYTQARKREMADPSIGFREKLLFVADEFQDLITADVAGMSDSNFWNVARSTGVIGFVSSQGMASLEQAVGRIAAENFALQMRNKIFLRVEDPATMDLAKKLAGKTLRAYTFRTGCYESFDAMVRDEGADPLESGPARIVELPDNYLNALARGFLQAYRAGLPVSFEAWRPAFDVDLRFIPKKHGLMGHGPSAEAVNSAYQAAYWRQEDRSHAEMADGNHEAEVLRDEDLISMGRAHAYVYLQRAGATRQDLAEIG